MKLNLFLTRMPRRSIFINMDRSNGINITKLITYRKSLSLSQRGVEILAGLGQNTVRNAEEGKNITVSTLQKIARALGVPAAIFLD